MPDQMHRLIRVQLETRRCRRGQGETRRRLRAAAVALRRQRECGIDRGRCDAVAVDGGGGAAVLAGEHDVLVVAARRNRAERAARIDQQRHGLVDHRRRHRNDVMPGRLVGEQPGNVIGRRVVAGDATLVDGQLRHRTIVEHGIGLDALQRRDVRRRGLGGECHELLHLRLLARSEGVEQLAELQRVVESLHRQRIGLRVRLEALHEDDVPGIRVERWRRRQRRQHRRAGQQRAEEEGSVAEAQRSGQTMKIDDREHAWLRCEKGQVRPGRLSACRAVRIRSSGRRSCRPSTA